MEFNRLRLSTRTRKKNWTSCPLKEVEKDKVLIKTHRLPETILCLKKLTAKEIEYYSKPASQSQQLNAKKSSRVTKSKLSIPAPKSRKVEIKLDTLKAGEIEALIKDLYKKSQPVSSSSGNHLDDSNLYRHVRKSSRNIKPKKTIDFEKFDSSSDDEAGETLQVLSKDDDDDYDKVQATRSLSKRSNSNLSKSNRGKGPAKSGVCSNRTLCRVCEISFKSMFEYKEHMKKSHLTTESLYICPKCNFGYFPLEKFNRHMDYHSYVAKNGVIRPEKVLGCDLCPMRFTCQYQLNNHIKFHEKSINSNKPFECPQCHHRFNNKHNLRRHFTLHLENNPYECKFSGCGKKFNSDYNLRRHAALHVKRVVLKCPHCPASYTYEYKRKRHIERYHSENSTVTQIRPSVLHKRKYRIQNINELAPDQQYQSMNSLKTLSHVANIQEETKAEEESRFEVESIHLADRIVINQDNQNDIHFKGEAISPVKQARRSRSISPLDSKDNVKNSDPNKDGRSNFLFKTFRSDPVVKEMQKNNPLGVQKILYPPTNLNNAYGEFKCKHCCWAGSRVFLFQQHMNRVHKLPLPTVAPLPSTDNPLGISLICGSCGYSSTSANDLDSHMLKSHKMNNKFLCTYCTSRFMTKVKLENHVKRIHLSERKHACSKCDSRYFTASVLRKHIREKHDPEYRKLMEKKFKCGICDKVLPNQPSYNRHIILHTDKRELNSCKLCNQTCAGKESLKRHIQLVHLKKYNPYNDKRKLKSSANVPNTTATNVETTTSDSTIHPPDEEKRTEIDNLSSTTHEILGF